MYTGWWRDEEVWQEMTDEAKTYVLGSGRLYFEGGTGKLREIGKTKELAMGFSTTVPLARDTYRDIYQKIVMVWLIGYNPNLLLTDQRPPLRKFADRVTLGEPYMPDDEINLMRKREPTFYHGGTVTGRFSGGPIPAVLPRKGLYRYQMGARKLSETYGNVGYSVQVAVDVERFNAKIREYQEQVARWQEKVWIKVIFGTQTDSQPGDMFHREYRIGSLLFSTDRRKRKRGERLFNRWHETRSGVNWTRDEKRELLRRGYGRGNYRKD